jgi:hypothetical protein
LAIEAMKKKPWSRIHSACLGLFVLLQSFVVLALDPGYLDEMPAVERVLTDTHGDDELDRKARQVAALTQMRKAIEDLGIARMVSGYLPDEQRLIGEYWTGITRLQEEAKVLTGPPAGPEAPWAKWLALEGRYERDAQFRAETLSRYLSPALRQQLNVTNANTDARVRASNREMLEGLGIETSFWDSMDPQEQQSALGFAVVMGALLILFGLREVRRFGLLRSDPMKMRAGFRLYTLHHFTGTVTNYSRWTETERTTTTTTEASGARTTSVSFRSWEHESFALESASGLHNVHVVGAKVYVENGSLVSTVWGIRRRKTAGDYLLFFDRSTNRTRPWRSVLQSTFAPTMWLMLPLLMLALVGSAATDVLLGLLPRTNSLLRGFIGVFAAWVLMLAVLGLIARFRAHRFVRRDGPRLLAAIEESEKNAAAPITEATAA